MAGTPLHGSGVVGATRLETAAGARVSAVDAVAPQPTTASTHASGARELTGKTSTA